MSIPKNRFWSKVLFKEFIRHFRKLNDEQIIKDIKQSMDDLDDLNDAGDSFGSKMVRWSNERQEQPPATASRINGTLGGRPISGQRCPRNKEEFRNFVTDNNLHIALAEEWLDIHKNRNWCFQSGEPIKNWKGALKEYCTKKEQEQQQPF